MCLLAPFALEDDGEEEDEEDGGEEDSREDDKGMEVDVEVAEGEDEEEVEGQGLQYGSLFASTVSVARSGWQQWAKNGVSCLVEQLRAI